MESLNQYQQLPHQQEGLQKTTSSAIIIDNNTQEQFIQEKFAKFPHISSKTTAPKERKYLRISMTSSLLFGCMILLLRFPQTVFAEDATTNISPNLSSSLFNASERIEVTNQAMGARCAVAADFDGDGLLDLVSASSTDNAVSWFRNEGINEDGQIKFSIKRQITWSSLGSRIVTVGDMDGDGDIDVVGASYYDSSLRWFENVIHEEEHKGDFIEHTISTAVNEGQGVTVADLDNDGDPDVASASSGDNMIAVFYNLANGTFCEIKEVVDDDAIGARTVVAADLNGDGWLDLASASKDDDTVAWYPNDQTGHFPVKHVISKGNESDGAYSLVAEDIDGDGTVDLVVASNANDHVSLWRNTDGTGMKFEKTLIYGNADFVLSVTAVDFDRDGDIDVASAGFFDGYIRWHENVDGKGYIWKNHTVYIGGSGLGGAGGHYVSNEDMDGDGDADLIAVNHHENSVYVFLANTECDEGPRSNCCRIGSYWNDTACESCPRGTYGTSELTCEACPQDACTIPGEWNVVPPTCAGITGCNNAEESIAHCSCPENESKDPDSDVCVTCPAGQQRIEYLPPRGMDTLGNYTLWEQQQGVCTVPQIEENKHYIHAVVPVGYTFLAVALALSVFFAVWTSIYRKVRIIRASQPFFLIIICIGTAIMTLTIIPISVDDEFYPLSNCHVACMSTPWLFSTGFTIAFSALFSKIWRLNKVHQSTLRRIKIRERDVLTPFAFLFTLNFLILLVWTIFDPLRWVREPVYGSISWDTYGHCASSSHVSTVCIVLLILVALVSLVLATVQSYKARMISDEFSESKYVGIVIICWLQLLVVSLPLLFLVHTNPMASYFLKTAMIFVTSTSLLLLMFVPKMILKQKQRRERKEQRGGKIRVSMAVQRLSYKSTSSHSHRTNSMGNGHTPFQSENHDEDAHKDSTTAMGSAFDTGGSSSRRHSMIHGTRGMLIINPKLEIIDLQTRNAMLEAQNEDLKLRNEELERLLCKDENDWRRNSVDTLGGHSSTHNQRSGNLVRFDDDDTDLENVCSIHGDETSRDDNDVDGSIITMVKNMEKAMEKENSTNSNPEYDDTTIHHLPEDGGNNATAS